MNSQSSYRQIFKATSLFGGVQVFNVLTGIIRSKFLAIFLGPVGMGISSLLISTVTLIITIAGMGLNYSALRDISQANGANDVIKLSTILTVFRRWLWFSCFLGVVLLIGFSPLLSRFTFGDYNYTWSFVLLSLMLAFTILNNGNLALLQGTRKLKFSAQSTVIGSFSSLVTSVPLYYFWGIKGIVPALIIGAVTTFIISSFFSKRIGIVPVKVSKKQTISIGGEMAKLGLVMVMAQLIGNFIIYVINTYIRSRGGIVDVGLFQAGTSLTNQSIGLVFTAMAIDYYPRLSSVCDDNLKIMEMVNQQNIITVLITAPLLMFLIIFAPLVIHVLLSREFYVISDFIRWLAFGTLFTAPMVVVGYIPLAKGDKKNYFLYGSLYNNLLSLIFYLCGYIINGLIGMAISFSIFQFIYIFIIYFRFNKIYSFSFTRQFLLIYSILISFCIGSLLSTLFLTPLWSYLVGGLFLLLAVIYSLLKLDDYLSLRQYLFQKLFNK